MIFKVQSEGMLSAMIEADMMSNYFKAMNIHHGIGVADEEPDCIMVFIPPYQGQEALKKMRQFTKKVRDDRGTRATLRKPKLKDRQQIIHAWNQMMVSEGRAMTKLNQGHSSNN